MGSMLMAVGLYATVKIAGYSLAGKRLNALFNSTELNPFLFGAARTLIGVVVGPLLLTLLGAFFHGRDYIYFVALVPVRFGEWTYMLHAVYSKAGFKILTHWKQIFMCIAWSFVLDAPAIMLMFSIPGGFWIC